jgi:hypothetical protein
VTWRAREIKRLGRNGGRSYGRACITQDIMSTVVMCILSGLHVAAVLLLLLSNFLFLNSLEASTSLFLMYVSESDFRSLGVFRARYEITPAFAKFATTVNEKKKKVENEFKVIKEM